MQIPAFLCDFCAQSISRFKGLQANSPREIFEFEQGIESRDQGIFSVEEGIRIASLIQSAVGGRIRTSAWRKELIVKLRVEAMNLVAQPKVEETVRQWLGRVNLDPDDSGDVITAARIGSKSARLRTSIRPMASRSSSSGRR